jgi:hypothetical protein
MAICGDRNYEERMYLNTTFIGEISGSHCDEYEDDCLLGCCAM